jgi:hypothetical protein
MKWSRGHTLVTWGALAIIVAVLTRQPVVPGGVRILEPSVRPEPARRGVPVLLPTGPRPVP